MNCQITTHTIVKNEDRWLWYAIRSVIDQVSQMLIYDTGSSDRTIDIIKSINSPKIIFQSKRATNRQELVKLRQEQLKLTQTPWFMLLDGDEIWPQKNLMALINTASTAPDNTIAFFNQTRNCVGDIWHYLPESKGKYVIKGIRGHLNIRLIKNITGLKVQGSYPLESYQLNNQPIQTLSDRIQFVDTWYLHTTHLPRSTSKLAESTVIDRLQKRKFRFGKQMAKTELPEVFNLPRPSFVPPPITNRWLQLAKDIISI